MDILNKIKALKAQGFSNEKISQVLNSMKIPTKSKNGKWHRKTVWELLNA